MNSILTLSSIVFPLITFPYVSRILLPEGVGKVSLATSVVSYFSLIAQLGIPIYGIRVCAKIRDNKEELASCVQELLIINMIMSMYFICYCFFIHAIFAWQIWPMKNYYILLWVLLFIKFNRSWMLYKGLEQYTYITVRSIIFKALALVALLLFVHQQKWLYCLRSNFNFSSIRIKCNEFYQC